MHFPVSGVDVNPLIPLLVAFATSFFASIAGLSGAFLLLPFQVSVLNFTSPAVSPTNLVFNMIAIPGGVYRYFKEGRMMWPLTLSIICGTVPGVCAGAIIRINFLPNARPFKFFVGWVLLYMGYRLAADLVRRKGSGDRQAVLEEKFSRQLAKTRELKQRRFASGLPSDAVTCAVSLSFKKVIYSFYDEEFSFSPVIVFFLALAVGVVGGIYGIGGGAIIAPFIVTFFQLPIYTIAGATLLGTFITSTVGVIFYIAISHLAVYQSQAIAPDWLLGLFFGLGGLAGIYLGARAQKFVPQRIIKAGLAMLVTVLAVRYILQYFCP